MLNKYEICLKMLEMAILETQIFKISVEACPQTPLENLRLLCSLVLPTFGSPGSTPGMGYLFKGGPG